MNVYDFDGTIYDGDSAIDFYKYCVKKDARLLRYLPAQLLGFLGYAFKRTDTTRMKQIFYSYFRGVEDMDRRVSDFWDIHMGKIQAWYLARKRPDDIVISASPSFLLHEACVKRLEIRTLIASEVDRHSGECLGANCRGEEKVRRLRNVLPNAVIDEMYSDSKADLPLMRIAKAAYFVKRGHIEAFTARERT
jgi:phosphoserine phosphatase